MTTFLFNETKQLCGRIAKIINKDIWNCPDWWKYESGYEDYSSTAGGEWEYNGPNLLNDGWAVVLLLPYIKKVYSNELTISLHENNYHIYPNNHDKTLIAKASTLGQALCDAVIFIGDHKERGDHGTDK